MMETAETVQAQLETLAEAFEQELETYWQSCSQPDVPYLFEGVQYALGLDLPRGTQRGKRIRPLLCLLSARALGARSSMAMPFALAIELMHNFALVHDDIEDGDVMRRGRDAVWVKYGLPHAINIGDYLLVHVNRALTQWGDADLCPELRFHLLELITSALDRTHIGQALDMSARENRNFGIADYERIVREKTGYYLAAPIQGGALVAGATSQTIKQIEQMAHQLGPLFQIMDDIIDLTEGKGREACGADIREGKRSYLVAHAASVGTPEQAKTLFDILDKPREATTEEDIAKAMAIFEQTDAIASGRAYCQQLYTQAEECLAGLPKPLADALSPVFKMLTDRNQ